jgi:hypothetical protein
VGATDTLKFTLALALEETMSGSGTIREFSFWTYCYGEDRAGASDTLRNVLSWVLFITRTTLLAALGVKA